MLSAVLLLQLTWIKPQVPTDFWVTVLSQADHLLNVVQAAGCALASRRCHCGSGALYSRVLGASEGGSVDDRNEVSGNALVLYIGQHIQSPWGL